METNNTSTENNLFPAHETIIIITAIFKPVIVFFFLSHCHAYCI